MNNILFVFNILRNTSSNKRPAVKPQAIRVIMLKRRGDHSTYMHIQSVNCKMPNTTFLAPHEPPSFNIAGEKRDVNKVLALAV